MYFTCSYFFDIDIGTLIPIFLNFDFIPFIVRYLHSFYNVSTRVRENNIYP